MEKKILLDCRDVSLGYEGTAIWEGLTFQVCSGDYLCIVGENGSGKSTLLNRLCRTWRWKPARPARSWDEVATPPGTASCTRWPVAG